MSLNLKLSIQLSIIPLLFLFLKAHVIPGEDERQQNVNIALAVIEAHPDTPPNIKEHLKLYNSMKDQMTDLIQDAISKIKPSRPRGYAQLVDFLKHLRCGLIKLPAENEIKTKLTIPLKEIHHWLLSVKDKFEPIIEEDLKLHEEAPEKMKAEIARFIGIITEGLRKIRQLIQPSPNFSTTQTGKLMLRGINGTLEDFARNDTRLIEGVEQRLEVFQGTTVKFIDALLALELHYPSHPYVILVDILKSNGQDISDKIHEVIDAEIVIPPGLSFPLKIH